MFSEKTSEFGGVARVEAFNDIPHSPSRVANNTFRGLVGLYEILHPTQIGVETKRVWVGWQ